MLEKQEGDKGTLPEKVSLTILCVDKPISSYRGEASGVRSGGGWGVISSHRIVLSALRMRKPQTYAVVEDEVELTVSAGLMQSCYGGGSLMNITETNLL